MVYMVFFGDMNGIKAMESKYTCLVGGFNHLETY